MYMIVGGRHDTVRNENIFCFLNMRTVPSPVEAALGGHRQDTGFRIQTSE